MARVRKVEIKHFRGVRELSWCPQPGINCLVGPGDAGKSTLLDAIDLCLGARRTAVFSDADFHRLQVDAPITIDVTVGELDDGLKSLDAYGLYLRSFDAVSGAVEDEPENDAETVLTVRLQVASDLEPAWSLVSARAAAQGLSRNLGWADRLRLSPTRLGVTADYHFGWRRGSVLNQVSDERADATAALATVARNARSAFGDQAQEQLGKTLGIVAATAAELGVPVGANVKAMLDASSVSFSGGTISLHDENGVPLKGLGTGSARLLVTGLQRKAAAQATVTLIDEIEFGLEPHRIIRLLGSLGAKEEPAPLQVFMTTHSPVAVRELSGAQLFVVRAGVDQHGLLNAGTGDATQSTLRLFPDAFLARSVIVGEGASEVGLVRGLDLYRVAQGERSIAALGAALVDCGGGEPDRPFERAQAFLKLGFRTAVVRDDDNRPTPAVEATFVADGGGVIAWRDGRALEDELFRSLTDEAVERLLERAIDLHGEELVDSHVRSASQGTRSLSSIRDEIELAGVSVDTRIVLGKAARARKAGWFKAVGWMEAVARDIVGPDLAQSEAGFKGLLDAIFQWAGRGEP